MRKKDFKRIIVGVLLVGLIGGIYVVGKSLDLRPFSSSRQSRWSIGIYTGENPFSFVSPKDIKNPVLTYAEVKDVPAKFVADPFMVKSNGTWYMFFEVFNTSSEQGDIGFALSQGGFSWQYEQIVLDEPFHLSYPQVFKWAGNYYMVPESREASSVRLYQAVNFPEEWKLVKELLQGDYADPSLIYYNNRWWLFVLRGEDELCLYYSDSLEETWKEHSKSPLITGDKNISRPGGRMIVYDGKVVRYTQDGDPTYGNQLRAFEIDILTTTDYAEHEVKESPVLKASGQGWNADGMHHIDLHQLSGNRWIACVDGLRKKE